MWKSIRTSKYITHLFKPRKRNLKKTKLIMWHINLVFSINPKWVTCVCSLGLFNPKGLKGHICFLCTFSIRYTNLVLHLIHYFHTNGVVGSSRFYLLTKHRNHMMVKKFLPHQKLPTLGDYFRHTSHKFGGIMIPRQTNVNSFDYNSNGPIFTYF